MYTFGRFRLDASRRLLIVGNDVRAMPEKLFRMLLVLLEANGGVVDKETFFARVWPDEIISEGNLAQHIFLLRKFLGDERTISRARDTASPCAAPKPRTQITTTTQKAGPAWDLAQAADSRA
jgi:DNA-binding response OmpR family regulator